MKKPHETLLALDSIGVITGIQVDYVQTGLESSENICTLTGMVGTLKGDWDYYRKYLDLKVWCGRVAEINHEHRKQLKEWQDFEAENAKELAEYERLKQKFES